ncbi:2-methylcitrate dehydratase [Halalkalicoccus paucihalophilus]|uniref:2-methylcitrate dehydratase n=1 Tax=Halalkalicoccus paucihalophilus TaxID=1008153 RepID=A0A151AI66_9EURY|nr:MmgE/PrpD family protein [Halalkalicoccus paucihalophilus]KYH27200.1 2-methylcitrate dehydratase [Halalkalicoccus paucihalophilus]
MTTTDELAEFVLAVEYDGLREAVREELKKRVLDSLGIAIGALDEGTPETVRATVREVSPDGPCHLWGSEERASIPEATMYNTALTRYLDFMDSFLAPGETPHPSDNVAAVIACGEAEGASGRELLEAIGVAYEIQGELAWNAPVRDRGFDHVTHTVISATAGAGKVLGLDHEELRNAIGIAATANNALRVTRTEGINEWKGVASAHAARNGAYAAMLARNGMEGPTDVFEGRKGWQAVVSGPFEIDPDPGCGRVLETMTKRYVAETYAQSAIEGIVELAEREEIDPEEVSEIRLDTFAGAKLIIGGGEGSRYEVATKAEADHSLPYMLAAALIDRELTNDAYDRERIRRADVQSLLKRVDVEEDEELTERFEAGEMPAVIDISTDEGTTYRVEKSAFAGHPRNPMEWREIEAKFDTIVGERYGADHKATIVGTVRDLESRETNDLLALLDSG